MEPPRILVADDDAWILRMVTTVLEKRGYHVETASDGEEAYEKALHRTPDLLITDVMMPKMDGWALVRALRARAEFAFVPVIFLTALSSDDDRIRGFRLGADDYLPKPFRFEELDLRVAKTLRSRVSLERDTRDGVAGRTPPTNGVALSGSMEQVGLSALLTLLEMERKSGILVLRKDRTTARVFLRSGRVVRAGVDDDAGPVNEECVYAVLAWGRGHFEFNPADVDMDDEVRATTTHLLMEGARRLDEARKV